MRLALIGTKAALRRVVEPNLPRSCRIGPNGRRTSLRLEREFELALVAICDARGIDESTFFAEIDSEAGARANFTGAVRCAILRWFMSHSERGQPAPAGARLERSNGSRIERERPVHPES